MAPPAAAASAGGFTSPIVADPYLQGPLVDDDLQVRIGEHLVGVEVGPEPLK